MSAMNPDDPRRFRLIMPRHHRGRAGCYFPSVDAYMIEDDPEWHPGEPEVCEWLDPDPREAYPEDEVREPNLR